MRLACESDFGQLAEMKWIHGAEDDFDYGEHNLDGADKAAFLAEFTEFLRADSHYRIGRRRHDRVGHVRLSDTQNSQAQRSR